MRVKKLIFAIMLGIVLLPYAAEASSLSINKNTLAQGDTLVVTLPSSLHVEAASLLGSPVQFFRYHGSQRAVIGIPPTQAPGSYRLRLSFTNGTSAWRTIHVIKRNFPLVDLGVPETLDQSPDQVVQGFGDINTVLNQLMSVKTPVQFTGTFAIPLMAFTRYGSPFGELRKTGNNYVRHLGTDFTAPLGTPVMAIQSGTVRFATSTELYGNTVMIDHGAGIYSLYLHLSRIDVQPGETLTKGQALGALGQTGYAFGPHLHLSVKINGVAVDPVRFIQSFK